METTPDASNDTKLTSVESLQQETGSGVYVVERVRKRKNLPPGARKKARKSMNPLLEHVTLVVYGWQNVEPGTLSWVFPSVGAAVAAARAMKNAVRWAIVAGKRETLTVDDTDDGKEKIDAMRADGAVLIEEAG